MTIRHLTIVIFLLFSVATHAQQGESDSRFGTVTISTSAVCEMCVATIEKGFKFEKGVQDAKVDLASNSVTVEFKKSKTDPESIKKALTQMGYAADELAPEQKAYDDLHHCCKADFDHGTD